MSILRLSLCPRTSFVIYFIHWLLNYVQVNKSEMFIKRLLDARPCPVGHCLALRTLQLSEDPKRSTPHSGRRWRP